MKKKLIHDIIGLKKKSGASKILKFLGESGDAHTRYEISKETELAWPSVNEAIGKLEENDLVVGEVVGETRAGHDRKEYHLTEEGVRHLLRVYYEKDERPKINELIDNYKSNFPLTLGKWDFWERKGLEHRLINLGDIFLDGLVCDYTSDGKLEELVKMVLEDPDLTRKIRSVISEQLRCYRSWVKGCTKALEILESQTERSEKVSKGGEKTE